jgi:hypothetical protein|tara:strand:- start:68 stop:325 length:258 start_codon:yes stop_codon:yes gene_type:complete
MESVAEQTVHETDFPFKEIRKEGGDYWLSWKEAKEAGYDDNQIWSVVDGDDDFLIYGPPEHYVNHVGHTVTKERHDGNTYYEEKW